VLDKEKKLRRVNWERRLDARTIEEESTHIRIKGVRHRPLVLNIWF
jgi:hypothetical protein